MSSSRVHIFNSALALAGASRLIINESDESKEAKMCELFYPISRDEVLRAHPWPFAVRTQKLITFSGGNDTEFAFAYRLPTDPYCLRVLGLFPEEGAVWRLEGRAVYTDRPDAVLRYIGEVNDEREFDATFLSALIFRLASYLAANFSGDQAKAVGFLSLYERELARAQSIASMEADGGPNGSPLWVGGV